MNGTDFKGIIEKALQPYKTKFAEMQMNQTAPAAAKPPPPVTKEEIESERNRLLANSVPPDVFNRLLTVMNKGATQAIPTEGGGGGIEGFEMPTPLAVGGPIRGAKTHEYVVGELGEEIFHAADGRKYVVGSRGPALFKSPVPGYITSHESSFHRGAIPLAGGGWVTPDPWIGSPLSPQHSERHTPPGFMPAQRWALSPFHHEKLTQSGPAGHVQASYHIPGISGGGGGGGRGGALRTGQKGVLEIPGTGAAIYTNKAGGYPIVDFSAQGALGRAQAKGQLMGPINAAMPQDWGQPTASPERREAWVNPAVEHYSPTYRPWPASLEQGIARINALNEKPEMSIDRNVPPSPSTRMTMFSTGHPGVVNLGTTPAAKIWPTEREMEGYGYSRAFGGPVETSEPEDMERYLTWMKEHPYRNYVQEASQLYNVPENLVHSVMWAESKGDPNAMSRRGARGPMQLMPNTETEPDLAAITFPDPIRQNIHRGVKYLSNLWNRFGGDLDRTLSAYNRGPTAEAAGRLLPPETQNYLRNVKSHLVQNYPARPIETGPIPVLSAMGPRPPITTPPATTALSTYYAPSESRIPAFVGGAQNPFNPYTEAAINAAKGVVGPVVGSFLKDWRNPPEEVPVTGASPFDPYTRAAAHAIRTGAERVAGAIPWTDTGEGAWVSGESNPFNPFMERAIKGVLDFSRRLPVGDSYEPWSARTLTEAAPVELGAAEAPVEAPVAGQFPYTGAHEAGWQRERPGLGKALEDIRTSADMEKMARDTGFTYSPEGYPWTTEEFQAAGFPKGSVLEKSPWAVEVVRGPERINTKAGPVWLPSYRTMAIPGTEVMSPGEQFRLGKGIYAPDYKPHTVASFENGENVVKMWDPEKGDWKTVMHGLPPKEARSMADILAEKGFPEFMKRIFTPETEPMLGSEEEKKAWRENEAWRRRMEQQVTEFIMSSFGGGGTLLGGGAAKAMGNVMPITFDEFSRDTKKTFKKKGLPEPSEEDIRQRYNMLGGGW